MMMQLVQTLTGLLLLPLLLLLLCQYPAARRLC
jgi:hypothetical protein